MIIYSRDSSGFGVEHLNSPPWVSVVQEIRWGSTPTAYPAFTLVYTHDGRTQGNFHSRAYLNLSPDGFVTMSNLATPYSSGPVNVPPTETINTKLYIIIFSLRFLLNIK